MGTRSTTNTRRVFVGTSIILLTLFAGWNLNVSHRNIGGCNQLDPISASVALAATPAASDAHHVKEQGRNTRKEAATAEFFVLSFHPDRVSKFRRRNHNDTDLFSAHWTPVVDGMEQRNLDLWEGFTGLHLNASRFSRSDKGEFTPHAVGCYMSHWNLLRMLHHRPASLRPDAYFVFEDDARCIPNLKRRVFNLIPHLPSDWDMLYVGGKPISQFTRKPSPDRIGPNASVETLRRDICRGAFGKAKSPLNPDGTRALSLKDQYWQTKYTLNTEAYVINPQHLSRIMTILDPMNGHDTIDFRLAEAMEAGKLNAYMPTKAWCGQAKGNEEPLQQPYRWFGYFNWFRNDITNWTTLHPGLGQTHGDSDFPHLWGPLLLEDQKDCKF